MLVRIGVAIRTARLAQGISQEALALSTELDRSYVGGIERGEHNVGLITIRRICKTLKITPSELFKASGY